MIEVLVGCALVGALIAGGAWLARWDRRRMWRNAIRDANAYMRRNDPNWIDRP